MNAFALFAVVTGDGGLRDRVLEALRDPNVALIVVALGLAGMIFELTAPGLIVPGVLGGLLTALGVAALTALPLNGMGVALLLLAVLLFVLEWKLFTHGLLSAGGALAMLAGSAMLVDSPEPEMRIRLATALAVTLPLAAISALLVTLAVRARRNKVVTGAEGMIGQWAVAIEDLAPLGRVSVRGENWQARSRGTVPRGARVRIEGITNLLLEVEPLQMQEELKR